MPGKQFCGDHHRGMGDAPLTGGSVTGSTATALSAHWVFGKRSSEVHNNSGTKFNVFPNIEYKGCIISNFFWGPWSLKLRHL